jgi:hypothetical protein
VQHPLRHVQQVQQVGGPTAVEVEARATAATSLIITESNGLAAKRPSAYTSRLSLILIAHHDALGRTRTHRAPCR